MKFLESHIECHIYQGGLEKDPFIISVAVQFKYISSKLQSDLQYFYFRNSYNL